jgi:hypothetical protein
MKIYRTKEISINEKQYTIQFAVNKDESAYEMIVVNDGNGKRTKYGFSKETAQDFNHVTGDELKEMVLDQIKSDIENGII